MIRLAKSAGFCFGVSRAVELVEKAAREGGKVVTLGPIIHNRHAVSRLEGMGVGVIGSPDEAESGSTVVIRSHGVTRAVQQALEQTGVTIIDATCPFVKRIHGIVEKATVEGRFPVIFGARNHQRCRGLPAGAIIAWSSRPRKNWKTGLFLVNAM